MSLFNLSDPSKLTLIPLGIGNAFTRKYFNSSFLILCGGKVHLVDAPAPLRHIFQSTGTSLGVPALDIDTVDSLILTHLHGDHCNGVEELGFWRRFYSDKERPGLYMLPELVNKLWDNRLSAAMRTEQDEQVSNLGDYFDVHPFSPSESSDLGMTGLRIEARYTVHFVPCIGFRIFWNGYSLGYSCDTAFDPGMIDFLKDCDLIIHETGPDLGHTPIENLLNLPDSIRKKMRLIHIPDDHDIATSPIPVLEQGKMVVVGQDK